MKSKMYLNLSKLPSPVVSGHLKLETKMLDPLINVITAGSGHPGISIRDLHKMEMNA